MKVDLTVERGPMAGKKFEFSQHDTFLFGRAPTATCCLPKDNFISRHHFLLEVNPPRVFARDLGSLNGTIVNDRKYGGREPGSKPPSGTQDHPKGAVREDWNRSEFEVELRNGDTITVGDTVMRITVTADVECSRCGAVIPHDQRDKLGKGNNIFLCETCRKAEAPKSEREKEYPAVPGKPAVPKPIARPIAQPARDPKKEAAAADALMRLLKEAGLLGKPQKIPAFPGYEVTRKLGEGGMGAVYLGRSQSDGKPVAIKVIRPDCNTSDVVIQRFRDREIPLSRQMVHENIVMCYEGNYSDGVFFIVMEFVEGTDVQRLLESKGRIDVPTAVQIMIQALCGLEYIHSYNVVHRDLKPPNILLGRKGPGWIPKIADFGLSKNLKSSASITKKGDIAGSIPYMPPEQILDFKHVGFPSDVYSMGATLYHMLSGTFTRDFPPGMDPLLAIIQTENVPIRKRFPQIPPALAEVVETSIAAAPGKRFQTAKDFRLALSRAL